MARLCALENKGPLKTSLSQTKVNEQLYQRDVDYEYVLIARQSLFPRFEIFDPRPMAQWKKEGRMLQRLIPDSGGEFAKSSVPR